MKLQTISLPPSQQFPTAQIGIQKPYEILFPPDYPINLQQLHSKTLRRARDDLGRRYELGTFGSK